MRMTVIAVLTIGLVSSSLAARQARSGGASAPATGACSLLPKELALKVTSTNKALFNLPPRESSSGKGTECNYGDITLRIDAFSWQSLKGMMNNGPKWAPVAWRTSSGKTGRSRAPSPRCSPKRSWTPSPSGAT